MSKEFLRHLPLFAGLSDQDLDRLYALAEPVEVRCGELLMQEGQVDEAVYIVLSGDFEVSRRSGQQQVHLGGCGAGDVIGEISLLKQTAHSSSVRATADSRLLRISGDVFRQLLISSPSAALAVVQTIMNRLEQTEAALAQHERMAALGTLAAGLTHELNNPAAAAMRAAAQLSNALAAWQEATLGLEAQGISAQQAAALTQMQLQIGALAPRDPLEISDRAAELQSWLEARGVADAWQIAPALASAGWDAGQLAGLPDLAPGLSPDQMPALAGWLAAGAQIAALQADLRTSAERIAETVKAVKSYTHMDQAPYQDIDIQRGLEDTLVILRHKLRNGIEVRREYTQDLPRIQGYAGELNQVWTNLIDNAIEAMGGQGVLSLCTGVEDNQVRVDICDSGPGIPPEVRARIFDPFFTTKEPGVGTGLGLHIVYQIVVLRHKGQVQLLPEPGHNCFRVLLPASPAA